MYLAIDAGSPAVHLYVDDLNVGGGDGGIRTLDTLFKVCSFSKRVPSAARPRLHRLDMPYAVTRRKSLRNFPRFGPNQIRSGRSFLSLYNVFGFLNAVPSRPKAAKCAVAA